MVFSYENKYIFIAVPKTASSSISDLLINSDPTAKRNILIRNNAITKTNPHITANNIKKHLGNEYKNYYTFGFVRHPLDRLVSFYFFYRGGRVAKRIKKGEKLKKRAHALHFTAKHLDFYLWSLAYPGKGVSHYLCEKDRIIVNEVFCFENINREMPKILKKIGIDFKFAENLRKSNTTKHSKYEDYYGIFTKKLFKLKYLKDLSLFSKFYSIK